MIRYHNKCTALTCWDECKSQSNVSLEFPSKLRKNRQVSNNRIFQFDWFHIARLLDAAGCGKENISALTSVMDLERVSVKCDLLEIDAWRKIAVESNVIKTLYFNWDSKGGVQCEMLKKNFTRKLLLLLLDFLLYFIELSP